MRETESLINVRVLRLKTSTDTSIKHLKFVHAISLRMVFIKPEQDPPQRSSWPRVLRLPPNWYCLVVDLNKVKQFSPSPPPEEVNEEQKRVVIAEKKKLVSTCLF
ncbi:Protein strawberry notch-like protein [Sesbania bispinosa]|nr:Protein strawberry notch-like protein [Sesbania bispinosa]